MWELCLEISQGEQVRIVSVHIVDVAFVFHIILWGNAWLVLLGDFVVFICFLSMRDG